MGQEATRKHKEAIVYAWAGFRQEEVGAKSLPSSCDTYDQEYGWTADDFQKARGGTLVGFYTLGLAVFSLNTGRDQIIATRLEDAPNNSIVGGSVSISGRGDNVVLHRSGERLLDLSKAGTFDTLAGKKLYPLPNVRNKILAYNGSGIYFSEEYPRVDTPVFKMDLEEGLRTGNFKPGVVQNKQIVEKRKTLAQIVEEDSKKGLWKRHLSPFTFEVDGRTFMVDNQRYKDYMAVGESKIRDDSGEVLVSGEVFRKYIVAAVGFPEELLLERFPQLKEEN